MIPGMLVNSHRMFDYVTEGLIETGGTFRWKGLWFAKMDILLTTDPLDVQHVLCINFKNYPKGDKFYKIFDIFGDGIFSSDGELWEIHRKVLTSLLNHTKYKSLLETVIWDKVEKGLLPVLDFFSKQGMEVDMQEVFERFNFDATCNILLDNDPETLSADLPCIPLVKAFSHAEEAILHRHVRPLILWKLQQFLGIGNEKKLSDAMKTIDDFIYKLLAKKQSEYNTMTCGPEKSFLVLPTLLRDIKDRYSNFGDPNKLLRDILFNFIAAGRDTLSSALIWFFYNLARNPVVEDKILEELYTHLEDKVGERWNAKELSKLKYLHGALCESLRLFPPVPINHKCPIQPDILPSGHRVDKHTQIALSFYSMGRMKSIWGEDCMEFKPERDTSFSQLKIVLATIIYRYHIELVEGHPVLPADSMVLQMKHGLKDGFDDDYAKFNVLQVLLTYFQSSETIIDLKSAHTDIARAVIHHGITTDLNNNVTLPQVHSRVLKYMMVMIRLIEMIGKIEMIGFVERD
ncbi:cytochrome P450 [Artemisia annua]|uniref:Cytochrome P450 n=1 Tax=Artemisia annua TaxID=35608 RepID=A0A2U1N880_ARTAN|nr:cytochrome P450 [Artemisia annua]